MRLLVGEGSSIELGTPGLILDVELPKGGKLSLPVQAGFNGLVHMLEGEASFGSNHSQAKRGQIAVLGPGGALAVEDARPGTRFMLMAGKPYGEQPVYNGPYVDKRLSNSESVSGSPRIWRNDSDVSERINVVGGATGGNSVEAALANYIGGGQFPTVVVTGYLDVIAVLGLICLLAYWREVIAARPDRGVARYARAKGRRATTSWSTDGAPSAFPSTM